MLITDRLIERALSKQLANCYLINAHYLQAEGHALLWASNFVKEYYQRAVGQNLGDINNCPDILLLDTDEKAYKKEDIEKIFSFLKYTKVSSPWRFIIINQINKLPEMHVNKLLKSFEEPGKEVSFLLLNETHKSPLATLNSRCLKINLELEGPTKEDELRNIYNSSLNNKKLKLKHLQLLESTLKQYKQSIDYNQSSATRDMWLRFLQEMPQ